MVVDIVDDRRGVRDHSLLIAQPPRHVWVVTCLPALCAPPSPTTDRPLILFPPPQQRIAAEMGDRSARAEADEASAKATSLERLRADRARLQQMLDQEREALQERLEREREELQKRMAAEEAVEVSHVGGVGVRCGRG